MNRIVAGLTLIGAAGLLGSSPVQPTKVIGFNCGVSDKVWIWIDTETGTCAQTGGDVWECQESGGDYARASCEIGCERVEIENLAGCFRGAVGDSPPVAIPNHTVACGNGRMFDLEGKPGDKCVTETNIDGSVKGGMCSQRNPETGAEEISSKADCNTGCQESSPPGDCTERNPSR